MSHVVYTGTYEDNSTDERRTEMNNQQEVMLENVLTGSVDTLENWISDYEARDMDEEGDMSFEEWGSSLVEVVLNENREWVEA